MDSDETLLIAGAAVLPILSGLVGNSQMKVAVATISYVAIAISAVKLKHYLRRHQ